MFDSGASHHVASDRSSLHQGPNEIVLGNGIHLTISHTFRTSVPTHSRSLKLHYVLIVPQLRNNLIVVAKLCKSNNVLVEFFPPSLMMSSMQ